MEQETTFEEVNDEGFDISENKSSEDYESTGNSKILKGLGILAGIGGAAIGIYTLVKRAKKKEPVDCSSDEECDDQEEKSDVVTEAIVLQSEN